MGAKERLIWELKWVVRFVDLLQSHNELMNARQFRIENVGVNLVGIPEVLELLKLAVVQDDIIVAGADLGSI